MPSQPAFDGLRAALQRRIDDGLMPGAVMLVQHGGERVAFDALGLQRAASAQVAAVPMAQDSIFRIYSMTKPIVSLAAMMLVEQGRLLLSQPVSRWLPAFGGQRVSIVQPDGSAGSEPVRRDATVHDLLRHTAGLSYGWGIDPVSKSYRAARIGSRGQTNIEFAQALGALPLAHPPASVWEYSRATDVLGAVLEAVAGEPLGAVLQRMVFGPLGMADTAFHVPSDKHHRLAEPFAADPQTKAPIDLIDVRQPAIFESGGGGLTSTAEDYALFLSLMLGGGRVGATRLASRSTIAWMTADHLDAIPASGDILAAGYGFGLGFAVRRARGGAARAGALGQFSWSGMAGTAFFVEPSEDLFALVLTQAPSQLDDLCELLPNTVLAGI